MRFLVVLGILGGCVESSSITCPGGLVCPQTAVCAVVTGVEVCATAAQIAACDGKQALERCDDNDDRILCHDGVCLDACGNGRIDGGELCDDGNTVAGDECSARCLEEVCGNGVVDLVTGEECDEGPAGVSADGCSSNCRFEVSAWTDITPGPLGARTGVALASDGVLVLVFGGRDRDGYLADTWVRGKP